MLGGAPYTSAVLSRIITSDVDGGGLEVVSTGSGPGLVLVMGGGTDAGTYAHVADRMADTCTVHIYNRRGRGRSAARPADYDLSTEVGDLAAVLAQTGARMVLGHSVGGYFALAGARTLPIDRLALFDPAVCVDGLFPVDYLDDFERAVAEGDPLQTMLVVGKGLRNPGSGLPEVVQRAAVRAILLTPQGKTMARLFPTVPAEARLAAAADGPASDWADVTAETKFFIGGGSPHYYLPSAQRLAEAMPHASVEVIPRLGHDAVARATKNVVTALTRFLTA